MKPILKTALCLLLVIGVTACAPQMEEEQSVADVNSITQTVTPAPSISVAISRLMDERRVQAMENAFRAAFKQDVTAFTVLPTLDYGEIIAQLETWRMISEDLQQAAQRAYDAACQKTGEQPGALTVELAGWKFIASLYHRFGQDAAALLRNACKVKATPDQSGKAIDMVVSISDLRALIDGLEGEDTFGVKLTYAYLNTVYDDAGKEKNFVQYPMSDAYIMALRDPLPGKHIKDGWYKARDRGKRKHTGTDIRASANTPILSCTAGVVQNINTNEGAGNYVVVLDDEGFEYHYYHMIRLTEFLAVGDRVNAGDIVGHVGSTGNSAANHLHLTIISPAYTYINPYPVLRDMRKLQKRAS